MATKSGWRSNCVTACTDASGSLLVLLVMDDGESFYSYIFRLTDLETGQRDTVYEAPVWLTSMWCAPGGTIFAVDADGLVHSDETGTFASSDTQSRPGLTRVWGVNGQQVFACGRGGTAVRTSGRQWAHFDAGLDGDLYGIHGTAADDLYVVGEEGRIFHYDGRAWARIDPPTNYILNAVLCTRSNLAYVCGEGGVVFRGSLSQWRQLTAPSVKFHSIAMFRDRVYLAAGGEGVFVVENNSVKQFKSGITSYNLVGSMELLLSTGEDLVARFDGTDWFGNDFT